uniref:Putative secreted protein n=1 Tax=Ixodes ricinus TaxID=34613 RepID=A0A6B0UYP6_IXORI
MSVRWRDPYRGGGSIIIIIIVTAAYGGAPSTAAASAGGSSSEARGANNRVPRTGSTAGARGSARSLGAVAGGSPPMHGDAAARKAQAATRRHKSATALFKGVSRVHPFIHLCKWQPARRRLPIVRSERRERTTKLINTGCIVDGTTKSAVQGRIAGHGERCLAISTETANHAAARE